MAIAWFLIYGIMYAMPPDASMNKTTAFRLALEDNLLRLSFETRIPLVRFRRMVMFDRFLARVMQSPPDTWVLTGGLTIQLRLDVESFTLKDLHLFSQDGKLDIDAALRQAGDLDLQDGFSFEVEPRLAGAQRYPVSAVLDGRVFEVFHVIIEPQAPLVGEVEWLSLQNLLSFAGIEPAVIRCSPLTQQVADKLYECTRTERLGEIQRVKSFADLIIIARLGEISGVQMRQAIAATFQAREAEIPLQFPTPPASWAKHFTRIREEMELEDYSISAAAEAVEAFLNPVLGEQTLGAWAAEEWAWKLGQTGSTGA